MFSEIVSVVKEVAKKTVESVECRKSRFEPFSDSARPLSGKIERPELDGESPEKTVFSDSSRPLSGRIENLSLRASEKNGLSYFDKRAIRKETGWSKETIGMMKSKEEVAVYKNAGLKETEINGKKYLIRTDIDMNFKDDSGRTNKERIREGKSPLTNSGKTVELHHIGQKSDSPLAELTKSEHMSGGNDTILHNKNKESEIDRYDFAKERKQYWKDRTEFS